MTEEPNQKNPVSGNTVVENGTKIPATTPQAQGKIATAAGERTRLPLSEPLFSII